MITLILGVFHHFCKSARNASRQRENFMESLQSDGSATYLLIIWVEKITPLTMKSKQKPYPSIVFLSIFRTAQKAGEGKINKFVRFHPIIYGYKDTNGCW